VVEANNMKIVYKNQAERFENGKNCIAFEYNTENKDINDALIEVSGRYPEKGSVVNLECKELVYVVKGSGKVIVNEKEISLNEGDIILIESNEKFFWDGQFTLLISCSPAWNHEQYKSLD